MGMVTKGKFTRATAAWEQAHFGVVMSGSLQFPHTNSKEDREVGKEATPPQAPTLQFCLYDVWATSLYHSEGYHPPVWNH